METLENSDLNFTGIELNETFDEFEETAEAESLQQKRRTNVGPWRNKKEFDMVYFWLFGEDSTDETKQKACRRMTIWKLRCLNLTPASILSTLAVVEVQLKDDNTATPSEMQMLYAGAFTRFLNYMCSTGQGRQMKTMYQVAMEIGIDPFIVDLRHLCAHGQTMPSISVLKKASEYCLNWLKEFYWDHEHLHQKDVYAIDLRPDDEVAFDNQIRELLQIYDGILVGQHNNCNKISEVRKYLDQEKYNVLKKFSSLNEKFQLNEVQDLLIKNIENLIKKESSLKLLSVFIEAFKSMVHIFEIPAQLKKNSKALTKIVIANRALFRSVAMYGFIDGLFSELVQIAENQFEETQKRKGASFWANQIVVGFLAFDKFRNLCKVEKEKNPSFNIKKKDLNNFQNISKEIKRLYASIGIDSSSILIFSDHYKRPWTPSFSQKFIEKRLKNISKYNEDLIKNCLALVHPPFPDEKRKQLEHIIDIYSIGESATDNGNEEDSKSRSLAICHVDNDSLNHTTDIEMIEVEAKSEEKFGIWSDAEDGHNWHLCPLGSLPWE